MVASDIYIEPVGLKNEITLLKNDNARIEAIITEINDIIKGIDDTKWKSPERKKVDEELIPYLDNQKKAVTINIDNCATVLQNALNKFTGANAAIKKAADDLTTLKG